MRRGTAAGQRRGGCACAILKELERRQGQKKAARKSGGGMKGGMKGGRKDGTTGGARMCWMRVEKGKENGMAGGGRRQLPSLLLDSHFQRMFRSSTALLQLGQAVHRSMFRSVCEHSSNRSLSPLSAAVGTRE